MHITIAEVWATWTTTASRLRRFTILLKFWHRSSLFGEITIGSQIPWFELLRYKNHFSVELSRILQKDVAWLESQLPNLKESVHIPPFNHLDFLWAIHVKEYVNDVILANMPIEPWNPC